MPKIPIIKAKEFFRHLVRFGCDEVSVRGSHHKIHNPQTNKTSVVSIHSGADVDKGTFSGVLNQLGIDTGIFLDFIK
jgi:predicted RNA binding protein YcfA (HicA-like mRNA interferase family)